MFDRIVNKFYLIIGKKSTNKVKRFLTDRDKHIKKELVKNKKFYNIHEGERCFILGNGPSIKNIDFKKLSKEYTFTVNQFARFKGFEKLNTTYHVFSDERFFQLDENDETDRETLSYFKKMINSSKDIQFFSKMISKEYIENSKYFDGIKVNYYHDGLTFLENYELECDISRQIPWFPTVVDYCVFIAMYMGFKEIYLLGCECTSFMKVLSVNDNESSKKTYGYEVTDKENERIKKQLRTSGIADELEVCSKVLRYYDYLEKYSFVRNVKIVNCTEGGILETFAREKLDNVLK